MNNLYDVMFDSHARALALELITDHDCITAYLYDDELDQHVALVSWSYNKQEHKDHVIVTCYVGVGRSAAYAMTVTQFVKLTINDINQIKALVITTRDLQRVIEDHNASIMSVLLRQ